jgi:hypothetical protein
MFVFSRRAIQERLHALEHVLDPDQTDKIAARLNTADGHRLAAMWEVIFLYAFSRIGNLKSELALATGKRPDVAFTFPGETTIGLLADISAVSDEGLDKGNPIKWFSEEVAREAGKVGLPPGGIQYRTESRRKSVRGGEKVVLDLPPLSEFPTFFQNHVRPFLRRAKVEGASVVPLVVNTDTIRISIGYDGTQYTTGSYPAYDHATSLLANPIMNRLHEKAGAQLKGLDRSILKGVIICDADCANMRRSGMSVALGTFSPNAIAKEFLRTNASFDFVIFATVRSNNSTFQNTEAHSHELTFVTSASGETKDRLQSLCMALSAHIPKPVKNITNAALRCEEEGIGENMIGGYRMSENHVRVSTRALVDVLSGKMTAQEWENCHQWRVNPFLRLIMEGRGIVKAEVIPGGDQDDDWIEFSFGGSDAAMAPFTARKVE